MAAYFTPTVIQQMIPDADMTPLERLLLSHIFDAEHDGDSWYFFSEQRPADMLYVERAVLETALAASEHAGDSSANSFVRKHLPDPQSIGPLPSHLDLDLSTTSWEFIMQDIVKRSPTLAYVTAVSSLTCSRMRPDGFGGAAVLISPDAIRGKSTSDILEDFIEKVAPLSATVTSCCGSRTPRAMSVSRGGARPGPRRERESEAGRRASPARRERAAGMVPPLSEFFLMSRTSRAFDFRAPVAYDATEKRLFHSCARSQLRRLAVALGLAPEFYDLRSNHGGIAVSGEITLHSDHLYVQASQSVMDHHSGILFRTCKGRKDYVGGPNNFASLDLLNRPEELARRIREQCHV